MAKHIHPSIFTQMIAESFESESYDVADMSEIKDRFKKAVYWHFINKGNTEMAQKWCDFHNISIFEPISSEDEEHIMVHG